ncbi:hypothetical protein LGH70_20105 [Hymenobacter sp. BT635]|uniref:FecR protein domain-containing protein n=1 Tax=Hymenobacter nitidus TaxID=2880929 RepID=A0ABS8AKZ2_9BACT|nr:hypothetical protein [Hymenobacter nitidus]MCB2379910.1 hypothetical protein [Hymenobacter nitidus]
MAVLSHSAAPFALLLCAGVCLAVTPAQAQYTSGGAGLPRIVNYHDGAYQLADGHWQTGQLYLETSGQLRVRPIDSKATTVYQPGQVEAFVLKTDTFGTVRNVDMSYRRIPAVFAQRLYRYGQLTAFTLDHRYMGEGSQLLGSNTVVPAGAVDLVLQPAVGDAVVVPAGRRAFTQTMLALVGDCPELAAQITKGKVGRQHMRQILRTYARWQQAGSAQPTSVN